MCISKRYTHPPVSTTAVRLNTGTHTLHSDHPVTCTKRSTGMLHAPPGVCTPVTHSHSLSMCPNIHSNCFQMPLLPLLVFLSLEFAVFLSILLCLPGRNYSRGENKLPHLPLCTSGTPTQLLNPTHRCCAPQTCRHPSCELSGGCCQQFPKGEASDLDFAKCSKTF